MMLHPGQRGNALMWFEQGEGTRVDPNILLQPRWLEDLDDALTLMIPNTLLPGLAIVELVLSFDTNVRTGDYYNHTLTITRWQHLPIPTLWQLENVPFESFTLPA